MTAKHPFRFGLAAVQAESGAAWIARARRAEELGYSSLLIADHYVNPLTPMPAMAVAAAVTTHLRVGTLVFDNDFRHPALLAKEVATLDMLSEGRVEVGIGAGWHRGEYELVGLPFDSPGVRIDRLAEAVQIIKGLFGEGPVTFDGHYYQVNGLEGTPRPVQQPGPPLFICGGGRKLLTLAGREADIVGILMRALPDVPPDLAERGTAGTRQKVAWVREAAGPRFDHLELSTLIYRVVVTADRRAAAAAYAEERGWTGASPDLVLEMPYALFGTLDEIAETLEWRRAEFGISYPIIVDEHIEDFAPLVARLAGR